MNGLFGLDPTAWIAVGVTLTVFALLIATRLPTDLVFLGAMIVLLFTGAVDVKTALSGFSDKTVVTVGALFFVVAGLESSGVLTWIVKRCLGTPRSPARAIVRMALPVAAFSSVMSNTTVTSLFVNVVRQWARKLKVPASRFLMPLAYAASLGGMTLVIGSTANLMVVSSFADLTGQTLGIFSPTLPGVATVLIGTFSMVVLSRFIPARRTLEDEVGDESIVEARVERGSTLVGLSLGETSLPINGSDVCLTCIVSYDGALVRNPAPETILIPGDTLAFSGNRRLIARIARRSGLRLPFEFEETPSSPVRAVLATLVLLTMVTLSALRVFPLLHCTLGAAALMLIFRCCTPDAARKAFNVPLLMVFAGSVVLGKAVDQTGLAARLAEGLVSLSGGAGPLMMLIALSALTSLVTEFISNTACAAVMTPIAVRLAEGLGVSPLPFVISVMLSCSASFATPIGSPTNLLVYGPGGYRFTDYLRIGIPMNIICLAANVIFVRMFYPF